MLMGYLIVGVFAACAACIIFIVSIRRYEKHKYAGVVYT